MPLKEFSVFFLYSLIIIFISLEPKNVHMNCQTNIVGCIKTFDTKKNTVSVEFKQFSKLLSTSIKHKQIKNLMRTINLVIIRVIYNLVIFKISYKDLASASETMYLVVALNKYMF